MKTVLRTLHILSLAVMTLVLLAASWSLAQDDAPAAAKKDKKAKAAAKGDGKDVKEAPVPGRVFDPAVEAVLESDPKTPSQWVETVQLLVGLKHPVHARQFVDRLLAAKLDEAQLASLVEQHGSGPFLQMLLVEELQPEGKSFAEAALAAARKQTTDPERLAKLVEQLNNPAPDIRRTVARKMRSAGTAIVAPLVNVLADPARAEMHPYVRLALVEQGTAVVDPLLGALETPDPALKAQIIEVLGKLGDERATMFLIAPAVEKNSPEPVQTAAGAALVGSLGKVPSLLEAVYLLRNKATQYYEHLVPMNGDLEGKLDIWHWDADKKESLATRLPADTISSQIAARLARDAYRLMPEDAATRRLYLGALLDAAMFEAGWETPFESGPAFDEAAGLGVDALVDLLKHTVHTSHTPAASAAAQIIGAKGTVDLLVRDGTRPSILIEAALAGDRRLSLAAVEAILKLKPTQSYPGASLVADRLGFFVSSLGAPRAVMAETHTADARRLGGLLSAMGYEVDQARDVRTLFKLVAGRSDCELVLISLSLGSLETEIAIRQLRKDGRTANLPIGLLVSPGDRERARRLAMGDDLIAVMTMPSDLKALQFQTDLLLGQMGRKLLKTDERRAQAGRALTQIAELTKEQRALYDYRRWEEPLKLALYVPELGAQAAAALGNIGTPGAQAALVELASLGAQDIKLRQAAAVAFQTSVRRWGTQLTTREIQRQYERQNDSEQADQETQQVLNSILDTLEARVAEAPAAEGPGADAPPAPAPAAGEAPAAAVPAAEAPAAVAP